MENFTVNTIQAFRLQNSDVCSDSFQYLIDALPLFPRDTDAYNASRDYLSILPFETAGLFEDEQTPHIEQVPEPNTLNHIAIQQLRQLRRQHVQTSRSINLDQFLQQPFDIQMSVFEFLHPLDLRHLSRTSKSLRSFLLSSISIPLWVTVFQRNQETVPSIPPKMTVFRWANLLYAAVRCDFCDQGDSYPDFVLMSRLCARCRKQKLLKNFSELSELLPLSSVHSTQKYPIPSLTRGKTWMSGILSIYRELDALQSDPSATELLKEEKRCAAFEVVEHAEKCNEWRDTLESELKYEWTTLRDAVIDKICKRLVLQGHDYRDVDIARGELRSLFPSDSTSRWIINRRLHQRTWIFASNSITPKLATIRQKRLDAERKKRIEGREACIARVYSSVIKPQKVPPWKWAELPPAYVLYDVEDFREMIHGPEDESKEDIRIDSSGKKRTKSLEGKIPDDAMLAVFEKLDSHGFIEEWSRKKMRQLASLLPASMTAPSSNTKANEDPSKLDLATSVFWCLGSRYGAYTAGRCLIGWEGSAPHLRCGALRYAWSGRLHFNENGHNAAKELVKMTGNWDETDTSALAREMDGLDKRFVCDLCQMSVFGNVRGRGAMNWRECVAHFVDKSIEEEAGHLGKAPKFLLLAPEAEAHIKSRERRHYNAKDRGWSCNHCSAYWAKLDTRERVISHVRERHVMTNPVENLDFIYFPGASPKSRPVCIFQESPALEYKCARCGPDDRHGQRLFCAATIQGHLQKKHDLATEVQLERDIVRVGTVLLTEPPRSRRADDTGAPASFTECTSSPENQAGF